MESIKNYLNVSPNSKISTDAIFIWIDILGFSAIVDDDKKYNELLDILNKFQKLFDNDPKYQTTVISDGIILEIKLTTHTDFIQTLEDIGKKQLNFIIENKHFLRGGIANGNKLENEDKNSRFISSGLARAVKIENKIVEYPIIGTNNDTMRFLIQRFKTPEEELFTLKKAFNTKGEMVYYIDFLSEANEEYYSLLCISIDKHIKNANILKKYTWLMKHYHSKFDIPPNCPLHLKEALL